MILPPFWLTANNFFLTGPENPANEAANPLE